MERIICLLILSSFKLFAQDEFIFWAELSSKNLILFHQSQNLSYAMTKSENAEEEFVCEIEYNKEDEKNFKRTSLGFIEDKNQKLAFLNAHKDELSECFVGAQIKVKDIVNTNFLKAQSETYVKILPLRFSADFGLKSVLIYYLKKK